MSSGVLSFDMSSFPIYKLLTENNIKELLSKFKNNYHISFILLLSNIAKKVKLTFYVNMSKR